jgi:hypothetical protein
MCAPATPEDPNNFPSCCTDGAAHCIPGDHVPAAVQPALASCTGGFCVPDPFIRAGSIYVPPACHSLGGADGVCLSVCVPQVHQYETILPQDICAKDERCAPCVNPLTGMDSGACKIRSIGACMPTGGTSGQGGAAGSGQGGAAGSGQGGAGGASGTTGSAGSSGGTTGLVCPYKGPPLIDPGIFPGCCDGAHCVPSALVPQSEASQLTTCTGGYCAPDDFIAAGGNFVPPTCRSILGAEGRCLSTCIPQVAGEPLLPQSTCAGNEKCAPCYDPRDGSKTAACSLSCDPGPAEPPKQFAFCCGGAARCVPASVVPTNEQSHLNTDTCTSGTLCVPSELLDPNFKPPRCTAFSLVLGGNYSGVCVSDCVKFGVQGAFLHPGTCASNEKCTPCVNPLNGQPTGAPGC